MGRIAAQLLECIFMSAPDISAPQQPDRLAKYPPIANAARAATQIRTDLDEALSRKLGEYTSDDASLVVFGSLARGEWTSASDLDWNVPDRRPGRFCPSLNHAEDSVRNRRAQGEVQASRTNRYIRQHGI